MGVGALFITGLLRGTSETTIAADGCPLIAATGNPEVGCCASAACRRREELAHAGRDGRAKPSGGGVAAGGKRDCCLAAARGWRLASMQAPQAPPNPGTR